MPKLLNLDDFAKVEKAVTLHGKEYPIVEMTVEGFIEASKEAEKFDQIKTDPTAYLNWCVSMLRRAIPSMSEEMVRSLSLAQLRVIVDFVQSEIEEQEQNATEAQANAGNVTTE